MALSDYLDDACHILVLDAVELLLRCKLGVLHLVATLT
jgi:hypothetical protein